MVSRKEDTINFGELENQVYAAVDADDKYWRENDAKFRAVNQKVATYEEFRDIVLASHIKPLDREDKIGKDRVPIPWNASAANTTKGSTPGIVMSAGTSTGTKKYPSNSLEFGRDWKRCKTSGEKYSLLLGTNDTDLAKIFKTEISFGLLGEILDVIHREWDRTIPERIVFLLEVLKNANRFSLSLQFLSSQEQETCESLFTSLEESLRTDICAENQKYLDHLTELRSVYGVKS